ncbi:MAG: hypothetical protein LBC51_03395 [Treponema sp.]|jgi:predicted RNA-binding Zn-ribbon protein involved in translation (DUF1610 family)|nr:hypothetical protein [Treponema sp.]
MKPPVQFQKSELPVQEKLRFFCDNCGIEVAREAQGCPRCGKSFVSVRCPACGFNGSLDCFKDCCPVCGYSAPGEGASGKRAPSPGAPAQILHYEQESESLPLWVYIVTGLALIGTLVVVFFTFKEAWGF